jgi:hypothetical protein
VRESPSENMMKARASGRATVNIDAAGKADASASMRAPCPFRRVNVQREKDGS